MMVLVACESSGIVREAFRKRGHEAWSCDILPSEDGSQWHIQSDIRWVLKNQRGYEPMIAHPPCTYLTCSAEWAYGPGPYHQQVKPETLVGEARQRARADAFEFFMALWNAPVPRIAIENPVGIMSRHFRKADQCIQPNEFGEDASKKTCFWLKNLPPLTPTKYIPGRVVKNRLRWANQTDSGQNRLSPSETRAKDGSKTYPGIAAAMAAQWGTP